MAPRSMRPPDIARIAVVEELDVGSRGADGFAVVVRRTIRRGEYESHLHRVAIGDGSAVSARRITAGRVRDTKPSVAPTGDRVAFLRADPDDDEAPSRLMVVGVSGGRPRTLAPLGRDPGFGAIGELAWSPRGDRIAFVAESGPARTIQGPRPPVGSRASRSPKLRSPTSRRIVRTDWRWDEAGHLDHWSHLFVVDVASRAVRQVTSGDWGVSGIAWHPDGGSVAFVADRSDEPDLVPQPWIWWVDVDAGPRSRRSRPSPLLAAAGGAARPAFSPNGRFVAAVGILDPLPLDDVSPGLVLARVDGSSPPTALGPELDRPIGNWADTDLNGWMVSGRTGPIWLDDATIAAVVTDRGRSLPERWVIDPLTGSVLSGPAPSSRAATGPWADVTTHWLAAAGGTRVVTLATEGGRAMEVATIDLAPASTDRRFTTRSRFGSAWQRRFVQPEMRRLEVPGAAGPIETWVASPPGAGDDALPTIVDVHGGPLGCWAPAPHVEVIQLTGAGYRVVLPNIRGSAGYGGGWIRPQMGDWGGVDADDVHAALDHVIALGLADPARLGALGLSYGGFMVNWLVGTSDRFAAAVSENGVTNQINAWANSDSGPEYNRASLLGDPLTPAGVDRLWRQSPLRHVSEVRTPLLILQAESDLRCPPQDNEQFFVALRRLRREVEYVLYPDESHVFGAAGRPDRRIDRMHRILTWFTTHLRT